MKTVIVSVRILTVILGLLIINACTNLDEKNYDTTTIDKYYKTDDDYLAAIGLPYSQLHKIAHHGSIWTIQEISTDEMFIPNRDIDFFDYPWLRIHTHQYNPRDREINNAWNFCFDGVIACNSLINQFLERGEPIKAEPYILELRALRVYFYYWLLDMFGNVPIFDKFPIVDNTPNQTREEVYNFINKEITELLPKLTKNVNASTYSRVNFWTLRTYQAKLYLNAEVYIGVNKYTEALAACNDIISSDKYELESNFSNNFKEKNENSKENIFVVPYDSKYVKGFNWAHMTLHYESQSTYNLQEQPWNGYCTLSDFYNSFDNNDIRKQANFIAGPQFAADGSRLIDQKAESLDPDGPPLTYTPEIDIRFPECLRQAGVRIGKYEFVKGAAANMSNDFVLLRLADIILMKAECLFRQGNKSSAIVEVNKIRRRAGTTLFTDLTLANLLEERGREMFAEGWRRQDMIRFGAYTEMFQYKNTIDKPCLILFPIPQRQLEANKALKQNECYK